MMCSFLQKCSIQKIGAWIVCISILIGISYLWGRTADRPTTHYHVNVFVYKSGALVDLSDDRYMEEISSCSKTGDLRPEDRVHLHENNPSTVHIHADGVAWGHFFANIRQIVTPTLWIDDRGETWGDTPDEKISWYLNGEKSDDVRALLNARINKNDTLVMVNYMSGASDAIPVLPPQQSEEYNSKNDPATCAGQVEKTWRDRVKEMYEIVIPHGEHTHEK